MTLESETALRPAPARARIRRLRLVRRTAATDRPRRLRDRALRCLRGANDLAECRPTRSSSSRTGPGTGRRRGASGGSGIARCARCAAGSPVASTGSLPPGPILDVGAGDGALLDALAAVGRDAIGLERHSERPDVREAELADLDGRFAAIVFWHSLEHLREAGSELGAGGAAACARRRDRRRDAEPGEPSGAGVRRALARPRSAPPPGPRSRSGAARATARAGTRAHQGQLPARRAGRIRLAPRPRRAACPPTPISTTPSAGPRRGGRRSRRRGGPSRCRRRSLALPVAAGCAVTEAGLRRGGTVYVEARRA